MNLAGKGEVEMKNSHMSVLGAGFSCIDIIKWETEEKAVLGGTAANVLSILSQIGLETTLLTAEYTGGAGLWFERALEIRGINGIRFAKTVLPVPRVVEEVNGQNGGHTFMTRCPKCGKKMINIILPNLKHVESVKKQIRFNENLFFYDRISEGIRRIVEDNGQGWSFYEPNSYRAYANLLRGTSFSNIIKFSQDRIPMGIAERLADDLQDYKKVQLIIVSIGNEGLKFKYREANGKLSKWYYVPAFKVDSIKDSSGAGDWLTAVFIFHFLKKYPYYTEALDEGLLRKMFEDAQYIASMKCGFLGAQGMLADRDAISKLKYLLSSEIRCIKDEVCEWDGVCAYCKV